MIAATVILPDRYCARDVTVITRDNGDETVSIEAFDAGGALWPVLYAGLPLDRTPVRMASATLAAVGLADGCKVFAVPSARP